MTTPNTKRSEGPIVDTQHDIGSPIICPTETVIEGWIDYNGHLNMAYYHVIFDRGVDYFFDYLGVGSVYARSGAGSCFSMEVHVNYLNEVALNDEVEVRLQLLDFDSKRLHFFQEMYHKKEGYLAATSEQLSLHVDMQTRKTAAFPETVLDTLERAMTKHRDLPTPPQVGRVIGIKRK
jgi:acyl-CoA thioester hydrolase|tara:strand:+ start:402 stop:935 length:534 start_codon:yes stop_codon:yes gene_type:complete